MPILNWSVSDTPYVVVDIETTGLRAGYDRIVEISVIRLDPGKEPQLVIDTLINPERPVDAIAIHGIRDSDVADAPTFSDIAPYLNNAFAGAVLSMHNVYFDMKFINMQMHDSGFNIDLPHLCTMYLRPILGLGDRCDLETACSLYNIPFRAKHIAGDDCGATALLLKHYIHEMKRLGIRTFADLMLLKNYKFMQSFHSDPIPISSGNNSKLPFGLKSRFVQCDKNIFFSDPLESEILQRRYFNAVLDALADGEISLDEKRRLFEMRYLLSLYQIRSVHAKIFWEYIGQYSSANLIDDDVKIEIQKAWKCLSILGWAPGE